MIEKLHQFLFPFPKVKGVTDEDREKIQQCVHGLKYTGNHISEAFVLLDNTRHEIALLHAPGIRFYNQPKQAFSFLEEQSIFMEDDMALMPTLRHLFINKWKKLGNADYYFLHFTELYIRNLNYKLPSYIKIVPVIVNDSGDVLVVMMLVGKCHVDHQHEYLLYDPWKHHGYEWVGGAEKVEWKEVDFSYKRPIYEEIMQLMQCGLDQESAAKKLRLNINTFKRYLMDMRKTYACQSTEGLNIKLHILGFK